MFQLNRVYYLLFFLIFQLFSVSDGLAQSQAYRDSIENILSKPNKTKANIAQLNKLVLNAWNKYPGENGLLDDALEVLKASEQTGTDTLTADAMINLVRMYLSRYESSKSLEYSLEAYKIYESYNNYDKMAYTLLQLGLVYYTQNNFQKSLEYYNDAVTQYEKGDNINYMSTLFYLSGINYSKLQNYSSAHIFFNRALKLKKEMLDEQGIAECHLGIAELFISQNQPDSAIYYLHLTDEFTIATENKYGSAKVKVLMAEALIQKGDYKNARIAAYDGMLLAEKAQAKELLLDAKKSLYRLGELKQDYKEAFDYLQDYMALRDSVINDKTSKNISRLEADYILNKKQNEILLLENENRNRTLLLRGSIIIGILAFALAFLFYNKQQIKQKANQELETANKELENTQNQLVHQEKLASLGQLTAGIAHEIKNPLNFVNNFSNVSIELIDELSSCETEEDKNEILNDLKSNLERIASHGERANSIITRMLDHSRTGERELQPTDLNKLIHEYYTLAYQAARINLPGFSCKNTMNLSSNIPPVNMVSQEISRVLLNLFNNSLYALSLLQKDNNYEPELKVTTTLVVNKVKIVISDNGPGIPQTILDKIFQPFFTTKPAGAGTGLGLSLSHDIIAAHGGTISVINKPSGGAEFTITLPV